MEHTQTQDELWQCDGCGFIGTEAAVDAHVIEVNTLPGGELKDSQDVTCWGGMMIGGRAWDAYVFEGEHPMRRVLGAVLEAMITAG